MNGETQLYRQIHPNFVREGRAGSRAFRPSSRDPCRLSVYDGDQITAKKAWQHYTSTLHKESSGVMAVTVNECTRMNLDVVDDHIPYEEHAFIEFGNSTKSQIKRISKNLRVVAQTRGWLFSSNPDSTTTVDIR